MTYDPNDPTAPFTAAAGIAAGLSPDQLRHPRWHRPFAGVRVARPPEDPVQLARCYAEKMGPDEFLSHTTAALFWGMWLPLMFRSQMVVHSSVPPHVRAPRDRRVKGHHLIERPGLVQTRDGVRIASPRETWCQLATILGLRDLVVAGDSLLAKNRRSRLRLWELTAAVDAGDRPRQALLERALPHLREGSRSAKETELRLLLLAAGLPEPEVNGDILDATGAWVAECDLVYRMFRVVIEYEGEQHFERRQGRKDIRKYEMLRALGWTVLRVTQDDLNEPEVLVARVAAALRPA